jgi:hypothetical protein
MMNRRILKGISEISALKTNNMDFILKISYINKQTVPFGPKIQKFTSLYIEQYLELSQNLPKLGIFIVIILEVQKKLRKHSLQMGRLNNVNSFCFSNCCSTLNSLCDEIKVFKIWSKIRVAKH